MSLRSRLSMTIVVITFFAAAAFGLLTYRTFTVQQDEQLASLLQQDMQRVASLLLEPTLGASFVQDDTDGYVLQVFTPDGRAVMTFGSADPLPAYSQPQVTTLGDRRFLVGQTDWGTNGGTIRLGHDIEAALVARRQLAANVLVNASLVILVATVIGLLTAGSQLAPLQRVAGQARALDPAAPGEIAYSGPADEIDDLVRALNSALAEIRIRQGAERSFLLEVAHELAGPLTLVRYHLAAVREEHPHDSRLAAASDAAKELLHSSQDLLVLARGELERPLDLELFPLADLLTRVQAEYPGVRVRANDQGEVAGDPQRLMQAVRNLVRNAVQASGATEKVLLTLAREGDDCVLAVIDEGRGIRAETLERIFDHHYSEHRSVGVGLNVARSLVEQHRGTISVTSQVGKGSRFEIRLPSTESRIEEHSDTPAEDDLEVGSENGDVPRATTAAHPAPDGRGR